MEIAILGKGHREVERFGQRLRALEIQERFVVAVALRKLVNSCLIEGMLGSAQYTEYY